MMRSDRRSFRRPSDAGLYYLCFGLALVLLVLSSLLRARDQTLLAMVALVGLAVLGSLAFLRYRPRQQNPR